MKETADSGCSSPKPLWRDPDWRTILPYILLFWVTVPLVLLACSFFNPESAGAVGDMFGSVNALFAGLAFAGIIITINLQRTELRQNTRELQNQADALKDQVKLMHSSSKLAAIPILIAQQMSILNRCDRRLEEWVLSVDDEILKRALEKKRREVQEYDQNRQDNESQRNISAQKWTIVRALERLVILRADLHKTYAQLAKE